jgi:hypothetical protein
VTVLERDVACPNLDSAPASPPPSIAALGSGAQRRSSLAPCLAGAALSEGIALIVIQTTLRSNASRTAVKRRRGGGRG